MEGSSVKKIPKEHCFVYKYEQHLYQRVSHSLMHAHCWAAHILDLSYILSFLSSFTEVQYVVLCPTRSQLITLHDDCKNA